MNTCKSLMTAWLIFHVNLVQMLKTFDLEETSARELTEGDLWQPFSRFEPELSAERLFTVRA